MENDFSTTFKSDFAIADAFGASAIKDTYKRAFNEWKDDYRYLTDLAITLNLACWRWYERGNEELSQLYSDLFYKTQDYAYDTLKGEEFDYYWRMTD